MWIKFTTSISGMHYSHKPGDVVNWKDHAEAKRFITAGYAVPVRGEPAETADLKVPETAGGGKQEGDDAPNTTTKPGTGRKTK